MDRIAVFWLIIGVGVGAIIFQAEITEAMYSIPPTPSFANINLNGVWNNATTHDDSITINTSVGGSGNSGANSTTSYIIDYDGTDVVVINGTTGTIDFVSQVNASKAIQYAMDILGDNNGGKILVRAGHYSINETIAIRGEVTLGGENDQASQLTLTNNCDCNMLEWDATRPTEFFFVLQDIMLDGNRDNNAAGKGIFTENAAGKLLSDGTVQDVFIRRFAEDGMNIKYLWGWHFLNNVIEQNDLSGLRLVGDSATIIGNRFLDNEEYGMRYSGGGSVITGNHFRDNQQDGLYATGGGKGLQIMGNTFFKNGGLNVDTYKDLNLANSDQVLVMNNFFDGQHTGKYGIVVAAVSTDARITANSFEEYVTGNINDINGASEIYANTNYTSTDDMVQLVKTQTLTNKDLSDPSNIFNINQTDTLFLSQSTNHIPTDLQYWSFGHTADSGTIAIRTNPVPQDLTITSIAVMFGGNTYTGTVRFQMLDGAGGGTKTPVYVDILTTDPANTVKVNSTSLYHYDAGDQMRFQFNDLGETGSLTLKGFSVTGYGR